MIFDVKDRDPRGMVTRKAEYGMSLFSEEILTEKAELQTYDTQIDTLTQEHNQLKDPNSQADAKYSTQERDDILSYTMEEENETNARMEQQIIWAERMKQQKEEELENEKLMLEKDQQQEISEEKDRFNSTIENMQGDEEVLAHKKGSGETDNHVAQYEMSEKHTAVLNEKQRAHNLKMDGLRNEIMRLMDEVNNMKRANSEHMRQIVDDASRGDKAHREKFKGDKETVENDERESKAKYQQ
jgi:hypothetical protein